MEQGTANFYCQHSSSDAVRLLESKQNICDRIIKSPKFWYLNWWWYKLYLLEFNQHLLSVWQLNFFDEPVAQFASPVATLIQGLLPACIYYFMVAIIAIYVTPSIVCVLVCSLSYYCADIPRPDTPGSEKCFLSHFKTISWFLLNTKLMNMFYTRAHTKLKGKSPKSLAAYFNIQSVWCLFHITGIAT